MNASVLFLLTMVFLIPAVIGALIWRAFRSEARAGTRYAPEGKLRWGAGDEKKPE